MARPVKQKKVCQEPKAKIFGPIDAPPDGKKPVVLTLDEFEAIRLADMEGLYQEEAAKYMETSRQTFARIISLAHRKIASALVGGNLIHIEGGNVRFCGEDQRCAVVRPGCWKDAYGKQEIGGD